MLTGELEALQSLLAFDLNWRLIRSLKTVVPQNTCTCFLGVGRRQPVLILFDRQHILSATPLPASVSMCPWLTWRVRERLAHLAAWRETENVPVCSGQSFASMWHAKRFRVSAQQALSSLRCQPPTPQESWRIIILHHRSTCDSFLSLCSVAGADCRIIHHTVPRNQTLLGCSSLVS